MFAFVGSRTTRERNARGEGITTFHFNQETGALRKLHVLGDLVNPSFLVLHPAGHTLYAVHGDESYVSSFRVNLATGEIAFLNRQDSVGKNPVHLALDASARYLVVSNHITSSLAVLPVAESGELQAVSQLVKLEGKIGPHRIEQPFSKPHFNPFDPSGRYCLVPDKGLDKVFVFRFENGKLTPAECPELLCREGSGPRHMAFHPIQPWVYVLGELDSTVLVCEFNAQTGQLKPFQIVSSLSESFTGNSRASEIEVDASGRTLFASNRGEDSIAAFSIDPSSGRLHSLQTLPSGGKTPRFFTTDPSGQWLWVLNEDSDHIASFAIDPNSRLPQSPATQTHACGSPVCMVFLKNA
jgi:6-phosphogluconolactonase